MLLVGTCARPRLRLFLCMAIVCVAFLCFGVLHVSKQGVEQHVSSSSLRESVSAACRDIPDTRSAPIKYLSDVLQVEGEIDEFGKSSPFLRPVSVVRKLMEAGLAPGGQEGDGKRPGRPLYAVNFGARDGRGERGNTDPVYPIFAELGFHGMAVEASPAVFPLLNLTMTGFPVRAVNSFVTVDNAPQLIRDAGLPRVDVFKIDIDSFDCDVTPEVLEAYKPLLVIAEYNVYFPPPIKMKLVPSPSGYDSERRSNIYECSISHLDEDVMKPHGYVLLQLDWENVIYARQDIAAALGMKQGVDVQAAYHRGYTTQPNRSTLIPWGDWVDFEGGNRREHGLGHLLEISNHEERAAAAFMWADVSSHMQEEGAVIGCGNRYTTLQWPVSPEFTSEATTPGPASEALSLE